MFVIIVEKLSGWLSFSRRLESFAYEIVNFRPWRFLHDVWSISDCLIDNIPSEWVGTNMSHHIVDVAV